MLPKAVAFIDYEHWYVSVKKNFGLRPDIKAWYDELSESVTLVDAFFFADFSHRSLADEIGRIRPFSNKIIDTRNTNGNVTKDFTDFIILDNIYQKAIDSEDIDVFILFSGDGHFSSVCSFIKNKVGKELWVYGIRNSFSKQLQEIASRSCTLPTKKELKRRYNRVILDEIALNEKNGVSSEREKILQSASKKIKGNQDEISRAMEELLVDGFLSERNILLSRKQRKKILFVDWSKVQCEGLIDDE